MIYPFLDTTFLSGAVSVNMSIELLQWWRWNQFCQFWVLMTKVLLLLPVSVVLLLQWYNVTQQWHQIFSFSLIIVDWTRLPLSFATRAGRWDSVRFYSSKCTWRVSQYDLVKNPQFTKWLAMFRTKNPINYIANVCLQPYLNVYICTYSKIFRTKVRIGSPISSQFTTSQHWAHSSRQNPSTKPSQILDCVHTESGVSIVTNVRWSLAIMREVSSIARVTIYFQLL